MMLTLRVMMVRMGEFGYRLTLLMEKPSRFEGLAIAFMTFVVMTIRGSLKEAVIKRGVLCMAIELAVGRRRSRVVLRERKVVAMYRASGTGTGRAARRRGTVAHREQFAITCVILGSSGSFRALEFYEFRGSEQR